MANEKVYSDYLMHGRTKGSKNGISTTPGYVAVGKKAGSGLTYNNDGTVSYGGKTWISAAEHERRENEKDGTTTTVHAGRVDYESPEQLQQILSKKKTPKQSVVAQYGQPISTSGYAQGHSAVVAQAEAERNARERALQRAQKAVEARERAHKNTVRQAAIETQQRNNIVNRKFAASAHKNARLQSRLEAQNRNRALLRANTKSSLRESKIRNSRSDIGNAFADARDDAKALFKSFKNKFKKK